MNLELKWSENVLEIKSIKIYKNNLQDLNKAEHHKNYEKLRILREMREGLVKF